jgi:hypothetical protein
MFSGFGLGIEFVFCTGFFAANLAARFHSGGDAHFGQDISLQNDPHGDKPEKNQNFHKESPIGTRPIMCYEAQENPLPDGAAQPPAPPPTMANADRTRSTSLLPHFGQATSSGELSETSSSKVSPHLLHLYSYNGTSVLLSQGGKIAFHTYQPRSIIECG